MFVCEFGNSFLHNVQFKYWFCLLFFALMLISIENIKFTSTANDTMSFIIFISFHFGVFLFTSFCDNNKHRTTTTKHRRVNWHLTFLCFVNVSLLSFYSIFLLHFVVIFSQLQRNDEFLKTECHHHHYYTKVNSWCFWFQFCTR